MPKPPKDIKAFKHSAAKRAHIPSAEEAGSEAASPAVKSGPAKVDIPLNPVVHRGQDPELFWLGKYGDQENAENPVITVDLRSIYRHEHIAPEKIIKTLHRMVEADEAQPDLLNYSLRDSFGNATQHDEVEKTSHYYNYDHADGWTNRLMQGDSLLCMASMLHREGMAGQVQTIDTSRIALNIAKTRLMTAVFPYYKLHDQERCDLRQGFVYKKVPHITLGSITNGEPPATETLYDQPEEIKSKLRISGPFTVETLQSYEPLSPEELAHQRESDEGLAAFEDLVFSFLQSSGVMTGDKRERAVFTRVDRLASPSLHAEGFYTGDQKSEVGGQEEKKAYLHLGPKFGTVSKQAVSDAIKEARRKGDADWLLILGFSFESNLQDMQLDQGTFKTSIVRMHDDLLQDGLMKKTRNTPASSRLASRTSVFRRSVFRKTVRKRSRSRSAGWTSTIRSRTR